MNKINEENKLPDIKDLIKLISSYEHRTKMLQKASQLKDLVKKLFDITKDTGQSFESVAKTATEFSKQELDLDEILRRTKDTLILIKLSELLELKESIAILTSAINSFNKETLDSTKKSKDL